MTLRAYIPLIFLVLFVGWILYRLIVTKDLRQQLNNVYLGVFFFGVWGLIYFFLLR